MTFKEFMFCPTNLSSQCIMLIIYMIKYTTKNIIKYIKKSAYMGSNFGHYMLEK
jgi:hypothetical protein